MSDADVLKAEITNDPLGLGYSGMTPEDLLASLTAKTRTRVKPAYVTKRGMMAIFGAAAGTTIMVGLRQAAAQNAILAETLTFIDPPGGGGPTDGVDVSLDDVRAQLDGLVEATILTSDQATTLKNLAIENISRLVELGIDNIGGGDITVALRD